MVEHCLDCVGLKGFKRTDHAFIIFILNWYLFFLWHWFAFSQFFHGIDIFAKVKEIMWLIVLTPEYIFKYLKCILRSYCSLAAYFQTFLCYDTEGKHHTMKVQDLFININIFFPGDTRLPVRNVFPVERRGPLGWTVADSSPLSWDKTGEWEGELTSDYIGFYGLSIIEEFKVKVDVLARIITDHDV